MTKKQIFWLIVTIIAIGIGLYLKFAEFGDTLVSLLIGDNRYHNRLDC